MDGSLSTHVDRRAWGRVAPLGLFAGYHGYGIQITSSVSKCFLWYYMHLFSHLTTLRTAKYIDLQEEYNGEKLAARGKSICSDACTLKEALGSWYASYAQPENEQAAYNMIEENNSMLLSRLFFAAVSIYLSGIFDYEITHWHNIGLIPPTLEEKKVQMHTNAILGLSNLALDTTNLSPLLFLFPLRIAGARSRTRWQRDWIARLVTRIGREFAVATAISTELSHVWKIFGLEETQDKPDKIERIDDILK